MFKLYLHKKIWPIKENIKNYNDFKFKKYYCKLFFGVSHSQPFIIIAKIKFFYIKCSLVYIIWFSYTLSFIINFFTHILYFI